MPHRALASAALGALYLLTASLGHAADRGVRLVKASIPMPDGVQLAATLYKDRVLTYRGQLALTSDGTAFH
jgi:hypothetical protein